MTDKHGQKLSLVHKGKKVSEETRKKLSLALRGRKLSEETRKKISMARKGLKFSDDHRKNISLAGKNRSDEHRKKMFGRKYSEETRKKISMAGKGRKPSEETRKKLSLAGMGKKHSEESRKKMSISRKEKLMKDTQYREALIKRMLNVPRNARYVHGSYTSPKAGLVKYRSSFELQAYKILDQLDKVLTYEVEPFGIPYVYKDKQSSYYPDILVTYTDGSKDLIEVKPANLVQNDQNQAKFEAAKNHCLANTWGFGIWTEETLGLKKTVA